MGSVRASPPVCCSDTQEYPCRLASDPLPFGLCIISRQPSHPEPPPTLMLPTLRVNVNSDEGRKATPGKGAEAALDEACEVNQLLHVGLADGGKKPGHA